MKRMKKWIALFLTVTLAAGALSGCGSRPAEEAGASDSAVSDSADSVTGESDTDSQKEAGESQEEEDPFLTGEKPVLNILFYNQPYDMNADPAKKIMEEITGYEVVYHNLPAENASEKLMMEIASGAKYDMIYCAKKADYTELDTQNALMDISELLDKYGDSIRENVTERDWDIVTLEDGSVTGIPYPGPRQPVDTLYGAFSGGIAFRSDLLEELNMEVPETLDEFYNVLKAYKEKTGNAAFSITKSNVWLPALLSAFGIANARWYEVDGQMVPYVRLEGFKAYIEFMQKLYKEGLLDNDMPINATANVQEKFANGTTLCAKLDFWDIPTIKEAMAVSNPGAKAVFAVALAKDENTPGLVSVGQAASAFSCIPKSAENPEHAVIWYNMISDMENGRRIYIGEEGVSFEVKDGNYYPLFPAFDEYTNADKYVGSVKGEMMKTWWMARARKTPEMAEAFEQMNAGTEKYDRYDMYESFATTLPAIRENMTALNNAVRDLMVAGIVEGNDSQAVLDEIIATWEREGGLDCEQQMNEWWPEFNK